MKKFVWAVLFLLPLVPSCLRAEVCPRPEPGSFVEEPQDLRSHNGVLEAQLTVRNSAQPDGSVRYCFSDSAGHEAPNLRVRPGDLVILHLINAQVDVSAHKDSAMPMHEHSSSAPGACTSRVMSPVSTNLHFHGLTIPPVFHQDDVMKTSVQPGDAPFEYRFKVPENE